MFIALNELITVWGPLKSSTPLRTQTQLDTVNTYIANIHHRKQQPEDVNVLKNFNYEL